MIFWKLCYKISTFWAFFLEFFGLGNNLTLQDHYYTRAITLILGIERNEKNHFSMGLFLQDLQEFLRISCAARQDSCKISYSCRKHYLWVSSARLQYISKAQAHLQWILSDELAKCMLQQASSGYLSASQQPFSVINLWKLVQDRLCIASSDHGT